MLYLFCCSCLLLVGRQWPVYVRRQRPGSPWQGTRFHTLPNYTTVMNPESPDKAANVAGPTLCYSYTKGIYWMCQRKFLCKWNMGRKLLVNNEPILIRHTTMLHILDSPLPAPSTLRQFSDEGKSFLCCWQHERQTTPPSPLPPPPGDDGWWGKSAIDVGWLYCILMCVLKYKKELYLHPEKNYSCYLLPQSTCCMYKRVSQLSDTLDKMSDKFLR
jgi:hypothetical protein